MDYLGERNLAVLIYRHNQHPINVYVWPTAETGAPPQTQAHQGYHLVSWVMGGMSYWAVSDLVQDELGLFANSQLNGALAT